MKIFTHLQEKDLDAVGFKDLFQSPAMRAWMSQKMNQTRICLILWFIVRTVFTCVYLNTLATVNGTRVNGTCPPAYEILISSNEMERTFTHPEMVFMLICLVCFMTFDVAEFLYYMIVRRKHSPFFKRPGSDNVYLVHTYDHRILQAFFVILNLGTLILRETKSSILVYVYIFSVLVVSWTYMYFLQFMPGLGYLVIGLQRSVATFVSFAALFALIFASFVLAFFILVQICCLTYNLGDSFYLTFQIFLNQINVMKLAPDYVLEWSVFHILFVMITVILLLNFCIAILSESAIRITNHKDTLQDIQYLNASIVIEDRVGWIFRPLRQKFKKIGYNFGIIRVSDKLAQVKSRSKLPSNIFVYQSKTD